MAEITIDERIRHGKPTLKGTRITVDEVLGMLESGMTYEQIKEEYGLSKEQVLAVIRYVGSLVHGQEVHKVAARHEAIS